MATPPRMTVAMFLLGASLTASAQMLESTSAAAATDSIAESFTPRPLQQIVAELPVDRSKFSDDFLRKPLIFTGYQPGMSLSVAAPAAEPLTWSGMIDALKVADQPWWSSSNLPVGLGAQFRQNDLRRKLEYNYIISHPDCGVTAAWLLPKPKEVAEIEAKAPSYRFSEEIQSIDAPETPAFAFQPRKTHWLHLADAAVQLSQAYLSPNWYQGGNNSLSMMIGLLWNVKLNEVYHPNLMFENNVSYKMALNTTPQDTHHKYSFSEDLFQWNLKAGLRAFSKKWFYTFTLQFKTQFFPNYVQNSDTRSAAFLSPGELNVGLGMSYLHTSPGKSMKLSVSISPISYNLKSCIDNAVDHIQYSIPADKKFMSEIGSSAEATMVWNLAPNISWTSRLFVFTDYTYGSGDWENTVSFSINRFLSTQIYVHLRYDSSSALSEKWKHWMLKEILSFGFSYHFSTKV